MKNIFFFAILFAICSCSSGSDDAKEQHNSNNNKPNGGTETTVDVIASKQDVDKVIGNIEKQLNYALQHTESAASEGKTKDGRPLVSPRSRENDGTLRLVNWRDWCSGFFPGILWQVYKYTGKQNWRTAADKYTWQVENMKNCTETHDLGFVIFNSFGKAYEATGEAQYKNVLITAANSLSKRYNDKVKAIRSWDHNANKWKYPVVIDNMMNLELLFEASKLTGDNKYYNIAVNHANTTMANHFRNDNSCYHVVSYDPETGNVEKKNTHQGYSDESVWSRGHAWAIYGFTMCYRYTKDNAYLEQAKKVANFWFSQPDMPKDLVPYWDMCAPDIPNAPRDASAAAAIASALYELATYVGSNDAKFYTEKADAILNSLYKNYSSKVGYNLGFLLLHSTGNYPSNDEIDTPIIYADYYYVEALARKAALK